MARKPTVYDSIPKLGQLRDITVCVRQAPSNRELVRSVSDPAIVGDSYPPALAYLGEPLLVGAVRAEVIAVSLDGQASGAENVGK